MCEKYTKDGNVAILISPGYGAGWSTWNDKEFAYDKRIIDFWFQHRDNKEYIKELMDIDSQINRRAKKLFDSWGYDHVYFGGFEDIVLCWIPIGTKFVIEEYDGFESIRTIENTGWETA